MADFVFVTSTTQPQAEDPAIRYQIRRQAMSRAAARRKEHGNYGQVNKLQYPASDDDKKLGESCQDEPVANDSETALIRQPSCTGYERLRVRYGVDLLDLSALTNFHISEGTLVRLSTTPALLKHILCSRQQSYLDHLPRYIESSPSLDAVAQCAAARLGQYLLHPSESISPNIINLYWRALRLLQAQLGDPESCFRPETLCATQLLGVFELLKTPKPDAWSCHSVGASALIKLRGPKLYESDFEKALLVSHLGQIFHEALGRQAACFLEEAEWQRTLQTLVTDGHPFSGRGAFTIRMWRAILPLPRCVNLVMAVLSRGRCAATPYAVATSLCTLYHDSHELLNKFQNFGSHDNSEINSNSDEILTAISLLLTTLTLVARLRYALDTSTNSMELESQSHASRIIQINSDAISVYPRAELYMALKVRVAQTVLLTGPRWLAASGAEQQVPREVLLEWFGLIGWKLP